MCWRFLDQGEIRNVFYHGLRKKSIGFDSFVLPSSGEGYNRSHEDAGGV